MGVKGLLRELPGGDVKACTRVGFSTLDILRSRPADIDTRRAEFRTNLAAIAAANAAAAGAAAREGRATPRDMELNAHGDMTGEEFAALDGGAGEAEVEVEAEGMRGASALESTVEASGAQASAAAALLEAAEALSLEEGDLAAQLGFDDAAAT